MKVKFGRNWQDSITYTFMHIYIYTDIYAGPIYELVLNMRTSKFHITSSSLHVGVYETGTLKFTLLSTAISNALIKIT